MLSAFIPLFFTSCGGGPTPIRPPAIDASDAGYAAMELYDTNGDGKVVGDELDKAPGLKAAMATLDADQDGKVAAEEIAARIHSWQASEIGVAAIYCTVNMDGQPLVGATVTFEPESFLGDGLQAGISTTDDFGGAYPTIPKEERPMADMPPGLRLGFYRVKVSKKVNGKETIPAVYNTKTILGQEVAPDDPAIINRKIRFDLMNRPQAEAL